ncbi:MAG: PorV/PorQ family protein, partial [Spirochaetota bacterium]
KNKKILNLLFCLIIFNIFFIKELKADGTAGTSGAAFLEIGTGSRPLGMGEAFTAAVEDVHSIYYNPAGIATLKYPVLSIMHQELISDSRFENISFATPFYNGFLALSNSAFWVPPFDKIDENGNEVGTVQYYNTSTTVGYGQSLDFMELGGSLKYIFQRIHTLKVHSAAADLGILKRMYMFSPFDAPIRNFALGLSIQNLGTKAYGDSLPRLVRMGLSYYLTDWLSFNVDFIENAIQSSDLLDFTSGFNESFRINTGIETTYKEILFLRGGYRFNDAGTYSFGAGFNYSIGNVSFIIDTSYSDAGVFGANYSFNVTFKLIPKIITKEDEKKSEEHYQRGIKLYIADDIDSAIQEFKSAQDFDPYHKNVKQKINDLQELKELKKQHEELNQVNPKR